MLAFGACSDHRPSARPVVQEGVVELRPVRHVHPETGAVEWLPSALPADVVERASAVDHPAADGEYKVRLWFAEDSVNLVNALLAACYSRAATCPRASLSIVLDGEQLAMHDIHTDHLFDPYLDTGGPWSRAKAEEIAAIISLGQSRK